MTEIKSVGILSVAKFSAAQGAVIGLVYGVFAALFALAAAGGMPNRGAFALGFGAAAIVIAPLIFLVVGFIGGIISAIVYNLVAGMVGGIELELRRAQVDDLE